MKYELKPEHAERFAEYRDRWIGHAMRTSPMTEDERDLCRSAVVEMYRLAGKNAPRVVFVASPLIAARAAGCSAWLLAGNRAGDTATYAATRAATSAATYAATYAATSDATRAATSDATRAATYAATYAATSDATDAATSDATDAATYAATDAATRAATDAANLSRWYVVPDIRAITGNIAGEGGTKCAALVYRFRHGGNQWAGWSSSAEWYREVARLPIDWSKWMPWVTLAEHSGPRYVHERFCIISDFPEILKVDNANRPHSATGPFCRWRDGFALYAWHGIRVPAWIIEHPERVTIDGINAETNAEIRRVMIDRFGFDRYLRESGAVEISTGIDEGDQLMRLVSMPTDDDDGQPMRCLLVANSTPDPDGSRREYVIRVPPDCSDVWSARNWTFDLPPSARFDAVS